MPTPSFRRRVWPLVLAWSLAACDGDEVAQPTDAAWSESPQSTRDAQPVHTDAPDAAWSSLPDASDPTPQPDAAGPASPSPDASAPDASSMDPGQHDGGADVCTLPFEAGPCLAALFVYTHDAKLRACVPALYGGCAGNANRFETRQACEQACGEQAPLGCPPNRVEREICVQCGLAGGCAETATACAKLCNGHDECAESNNGYQCFDGVCQVAFCI